MIIYEPSKKYRKEGYRSWREPGHGDHPESHLSSIIHVWFWMTIFMKMVWDDDDDYGPPEGYLECDHHVILQRLSDGVVPANIRWAV